MYPQVVGNISLRFILSKLAIFLGYVFLQEKPHEWGSSISLYPDISLQNILAIISNATWQGCG